MTNSEALKMMQSVKAYMTSGNPIWSVTEIGEAFDMAIEALEAEPKKGKWNTDKESPEYATCSVCGHCDWDCTESEYFNFCPNCGADMRGDNHDK